MSQREFIEIERKYLVKEPPSDYKEYPSVEIAQTYLSTPGISPILRVRRYGNEFLLTVKKRDIADPMVCDEVEMPIEESHYLALKSMGQGRGMVKTRYMIPFADHTIEMDIFSSNLSGLILAEVEFTSKDLAESFTPPEWFGTEVTGDLRFSNNSLSIKGLPEKEELT